MNQIGNMVATSPDDGHTGRVTQSARKRLNHRGPLSIDVSSAWYFITICADGHAPWVGSRVPRDRKVLKSAIIFASLKDLAMTLAQENNILSLIGTDPDSLMSVDEEFLVPNTIMLKHIMEAA